MLHWLSVEHPDTDLRYTINEIDSDGDGRVDFADFVHFLVRKVLADFLSEREMFRRKHEILATLDKLKAVIGI